MSLTLVVRAYELIVLDALVEIRSPYLLARIDLEAQDYCNPIFVY